MGRTPSCCPEGVKKGAWTSHEDKKLIAYIKQYGEGGWRTLPQKAGLQRCGKSCRLRWTNYLRPNIKRGEFSREEEHKIMELHATLGNRWSAIAKQLDKRTDNEIKNYWNTYLKKRVTETIVPNSEHVTRTKTPSLTNDPLNSTGHNQNDNANYSSQGNTTNIVSRQSNVDPPPSRPTNAMQHSASNKLVNRLATRLSSSCCLNVLNDGPVILSPSSSQVNGTDVVNIIDTSSSDFDFRPSSFSAKSLLNQMARSIKRSPICQEKVKSLLSENSIIGTDTCTSIGDELFHTSATNGQTWIQPTTPMSLEAAETLALDMMAQEVPSHGGVQNHESLTEDFNLDFLQDWTMMDDDVVTDDFIGGTSYEGGVSRTSNRDSHNFESPMSINFEAETSVPCEVTDLMNFY